MSISPGRLLGSALDRATSGGRARPPDRRPGSTSIASGRGLLTCTTSSRRRSAGPPPTPRARSAARAAPGAGRVGRGWPAVDHLQDRHSTCAPAGRSSTVSPEVAYRGSPPPGRVRARRVPFRPFPARGAGAAAAGRRWPEHDVGARSVAGTRVSCGPAPADAREPAPAGPDEGAGASAGGMPQRGAYIPSGAFAGRYGGERFVGVRPPPCRRA